MRPLLCQVSSCSSAAAYVCTRRPEFPQYVRHVRVCQYHAFIEPVSHVYTLEPLTVDSEVRA
jgi:hypothetical protein